MARKELSVSEALRHAHGVLMDDLDKLEEAVQPGSEVEIGDVHTRLRATRDAITEHFRFEEQNGYMDVVRNREPRLERAVQAMADEHRALAQTLDTLLEIARAATTVTEPFCEQVRAWTERIRNHEHRENGLVQDAFSTDISAED
jgi:hypothetical protein